jgi:hypothetical protein
VHDDKRKSFACSIVLNDAHELVVAKVLLKVEETELCIRICVYLAGLASKKYSPLWQIVSIYCVLSFGL